MIFQIHYCHLILRLPFYSYYPNKNYLTIIITQSELHISHILFLYVLISYLAHLTHCLIIIYPFTIILFHLSSFYYYYQIQILFFQDHVFFINIEYYQIYHSLITLTPIQSFTFTL